MSSEISITRKEFSMLHALRERNEQLTVCFSEGRVGEIENIELMDYSDNEWAFQVIQASRKAENERAI